MNPLAIVGSPRKGKATDTLVDRAVEGARAVDPDLPILFLILSSWRLGVFSLLPSPSILEVLLLHVHGESVATVEAGG